MKIAVVANFAYGAITSNPRLHVGGVERQVAMLCRWLVKRGHEVSLITWDEGYDDGMKVDGVRLIKLCGMYEGIPGLRFFYPRWTSLISALSRAEAEIYYQNCAEYVTGQVALWCKWNNKKFVYSVASEPDCDPDLPAMTKYRDKLLYKYGINNSNAIIVQNAKQQQMLRSGFDLESMVLSMPCDGPSKESYEQPRSLDSNHANILWVGRIASVKRPDRVFELAARLEWCDFTMAGGVDKEHEYAEKVFTKAKEYQNVKMLGSVSQDELRGFYSTSSLLCCTSEYEGLPNTFLEAWSYGLPVISTVDPDNIISKNKLGIFCSNIEEMVESIKRLNTDPGQWREYSENAREYYIRNHSIDNAMSKFEKLFEEVLNLSANNM